MMLLSRQEFASAVFARDKNQCVVCGQPATAAHHILDRQLWEDGGYYLNNGVALCDKHHLHAENTTLTCEELREKSGIKTITLPPHLSTDQRYDKWGNPFLNKDCRLRGELFYQENVQKILKDGGVLSDFVERVKYPKTLHLPWSEGLLNDDRVIPSLAQLEGQEVVVTLKLDGENSSLTRDYYHARSLDSAHHPSRNWLKALHARIAHEVPENFIICGENCYAEHSIHYDRLPSYFFVFNMWEKGIRLSWDDMVAYCQILELEHVPILWRGIFTQEAIKKITDQIDTSRQEGIVVQTTKAIKTSQWKTHSAKWVRKGHVQTDQMWMLKPVIPNGLAKEGEKVSFDGMPIN